MKIRRVLVGITAGALVASALSAAPAQAAAPAAAQLVAPANGSTATAVDIPLSVRPTDPDGGSLQVRFEGRKRGATVPGGGAADPFTIVALPDTQNYTYNNRQGTITQQAQWAVNTRTQLNTAMVVQLGDLVSEEENLTQWGHTSTALKVLDDAGMPNTVVPGNHDFNTTTGAFAEYDQFFPPSRYANATWTPATARYGGYMGQNLFGPDPVDRKNMNNFALFTAGGRDWVAVNLEWEAPSWAVDWAVKVLQAHPDRLAIVTTHSFLGLNGLRRTTPERAGGTSANQLWTDFISQQCQVKLVLSGHFHNGDAGEANRSDLNRCGEPVQQVLTDYQDRANGGDGWLRYFTFDPAASTMTARTYSPKLGTFESDADSAFTVPFSLAGSVPAPFQTIGTVTADSGTVASRTWTGLDADTWYEWRAVTSDGVTETVSSTWEVRTPPAAELVDDTFSRNVSNGWGATAAGQAWQFTSSATAYAVDGSVGRIVAPLGSTRGMRLPTVSVADAKILTDLAMTPAASGSGTYVSVHGRLSGTNSYRAKVRYLASGAVNLSLIRFTGAEVSLATANIPGTVAPGQYLRLRFELEGASPTTLRAKLWPVSQAEPAAWTVTSTDATAALQAAGTTGIDVYQSGSATSPATMTFDRYTITRLGVAPPANLPPTALIGTPMISERTVTVSGAGSSDPDGTITSYAWEFGDGATATGSTASRTYAADGTYTVRLTVTDDDGDTGTTTRQVTVAATPPPNQAPTAVIGTPVVSQRTVNVSGSGSTDPDGTITGYAWEFGDGATGTGATASRTYAADGTYTVRLTVTDDDGDTGTTTRQVTVAATPPPNQAPTAVIGTPVVSQRTVNVSGSGSTDPDGTITGYAWEFGDGATATGSTASRTYAADGTYTVRLTVTDDDGDTGTTTRQVTVAATPPPNQAPTAVIGTPVVSQRTVNVSGSGSTDPDGTITGYAWEFGDGATATGSTASRTYAADGTYTVRLTVTDDDGDTGTTTRQVTVAATPPPTQDVATDLFERSVTNGWGSAQLGGAWTVLGTSSRYGVSGGTGNHILTAGGTTGETMLPAVNTTDVDLRTSLAWSRTASQGTLYGTAVVRRQTNGSDYRVKVVVAASGTMQLVIARKVGTTETVLRTATVAGITQTANTSYRLAVRATTSAGTTTLSTKLWRVGTTEPAAWTATVTDATASLQSGGSVGLNSYMSSSAAAAVTMRVDDFLVVDPD